MPKFIGEVGVKRLWSKIHDNFVLKETGKGLSTNDYTNTDKAEVAKVKDKANIDNVLTKDNTTAYTPTADYNPATKKYVDDNMGASSTGNTYVVNGLVEDYSASGNSLSFGGTATTFNGVNFLSYTATVLVFNTADAFNYVSPSQFKLSTGDHLFTVYNVNRKNAGFKLSVDSGGKCTLSKTTGTMACGVTLILTENAVYQKL